MAKGTSSTKESPLFSVSLTRKNAPWAFMKGEAFRAIAALELLGALVGVMVLLPLLDAGTGAATALLGLSCGTDNLGNTFLLDRMLTTEYPLGIVAMELSYQCRRRGVALRANWIPRLQNEEADALTNLDFRHFQEKHRIQVDLVSLPFGVMPDLFSEGEAYVAELERLKAESKGSERSGGWRAEAPGGR